ncbi:MAG: 2-oxo-4-hydroxy-4-carboxy-5-ureidoimidazoline decarboxylase [Caldilineaceae bacterium]|nr:2-oxo-4-hydroxy-4-carboxy-5-ureidoimidazoline decarboxylase [Caldilineaceae bacterium]
MLSSEIATNRKDAEEMFDAITQLNQLNRTAAEEKLTRCCGATRWVAQMLARRPFASVDQLRQSADDIWWALAPDDWREAFQHHPKIGDVDSLRRKFASTQTWAAHEQAAVQQASEAVLTGLAAGNLAYEAKFGYIFIVCATGKSAPEMLALLEQRLPNDPSTELPIAAEEQRKITQIRLHKLLEELTSTEATTTLRSPITTHVLDTSRGRPAAGIPVKLESATGTETWQAVATGITDSDGRAAHLLPPADTVAPGLYRLTFATGDYFRQQGMTSFYPYVVVTFAVEQPTEHYHVPLLLNPFGYSTYRGS